MKHGAPKSTWRVVLLAISGELEFNYSNDSWQIQVNSSPSHWDMWSWDFYTFDNSSWTVPENYAQGSWETKWLLVTCSLIFTQGHTALWEVLVNVPGCGGTFSLEQLVSYLESVPSTALIPCQANRDTQSAIHTSWDQDSAEANGAYFPTNHVNLDGCSRIHSI